MFFITPASADVDLILVSAGSDVRYGVYVSPYTTEITGTTEQFPIICDDFVDESSIGQQWTATVHTLNDLTGTKWGPGNATEYKEAAYLAYQILSTSDANTRGQQSFALWALFAPTQVPTYLNAHGAPADYTTYWVNQATTHYSSLTASQLNSLEIYTPTQTQTQEFLRIVPAPEASATAMLTVNLLAIIALCPFLRRARTRE